MNNLKNSARIIGNLVANPEILTFENGSKLAKFSVGVNTSYKNADGQKVEESSFFNLSAWGKLAEICEKHLKKGQQIAVEGKLVTRSYENKEGLKRYSTEISCNEILILSKKEGGQSEES